MSNKNEFKLINELAETAATESAVVEANVKNKVIAGIVETA